MWIFVTADEQSELNSDAVEEGKCQYEAPISMFSSFGGAVDVDDEVMTVHSHVALQNWQTHKYQTQTGCKPLRIACLWNYGSCRRNIVSILAIHSVFSFRSMFVNAGRSELWLFSTPYCYKLWELNALQLEYRDTLQLQMQKIWYISLT